MPIRTTAPALESKFGRPQVTRVSIMDHGMSQIWAHLKSGLLTEVAYSKSRYLKAV